MQWSEVSEATALLRGSFISPATRKFQNCVASFLIIDQKEDVIRLEKKQKLLFRIRYPTHPITPKARTF